MEPLNVECDLQSLRRLYSLLLLQSNANKEYIPQTFLLDENSQCLLKRLLDSATKELLARQQKILAQAQLGLLERVSTPSNSVSRGIVKSPTKVGLRHEVVDSIERIETQLSAFQFCSSRGDRTRSCMSNSVVTPVVEQGYSSSIMRSYDLTLTLGSQGSSCNDDKIVLATSRQKRTSQKMVSMKPTLLDQETESGTSSEGEEQVYSTEEDSEEASRETVSTSGSSWETNTESVTESDSSYPSQSDDDDGDDDDEKSPPHNRSRDPTKQRKQRTGRLKRFKDKLGKVFHHHHYHHHKHYNKPSAWKHLHLHKDKEKQMKSESKGLMTTHNKKGGQFHALVKGFMRHDS